jgi:hypothetical protein
VAVRAGDESSYERRGYRVNIDEYVTEDGYGSFKDAYVRDLLPPTGVPVRLLVILESPHLEEVEAGTPIVGGAGRSALEYLLGNATGDSLGEFIDAMHTAGDYRVAVMNVSNVPLQPQAFDDDARPLTPDEWTVIDVVRMSTAWEVDSTMTPEANRVGIIIRDRLHARVSRLTFESDAAVVLCGDFVQRFARRLTGVPGRPLKVLHPSRNLWLANPDRDEHRALRKLFLASTTRLNED